MTKEEIIEAFNRNKSKNYTHMIIVSDRWSFEYYPSYISEEDNVNDTIHLYNSGEYTRVKEVYNYNMPIEEQINSTRAYFL